MKKNNIYLATKLFSFYDRYASTNMYEAVLRSKKYSSSLIYLPFRDSNMKVSTEGNVAKNIFEADINSLNKTEIFICRIDGLSYDAGIGFELGYCLARGCTLYVFSTDFYKTKILNSKILISNMVNKICNAFKYEYKNNQILSYEKNLKYNIESFTKFVTDKIDNNSYKYTNEFSNNEHYDVFIDFCGLKYEWNKILIEKLITYLDKNNISYWVSSRYNEEYDCDKELYILDNSKIYINCFDENEPDFDSCVLHGYAYKKDKYIIGYESNNVIYYVDGMQEMGVNLMIEQSCNILVKDLEQLLNKIMELKNEEKI